MQFEEMFQLSILLTPLKKMYILDKGGRQKWPNGDSEKLHLHSEVATLMEYVHFQMGEKKKKSK